MIPGALYVPLSVPKSRLASPVVHVVHPAAAVRAAVEWVAYGVDDEARLVHLLRHLPHLLQAQRIRLGACLSAQAVVLHQALQVGRKSSNTAAAAAAGQCIQSQQLVVQCIQ